MQYLSNFGYNFSFYFIHGFNRTNLQQTDTDSCKCTCLIYIPPGEQLIMISPPTAAIVNPFPNAFPEVVISGFIRKCF